MGEEEVISYSAEEVVSILKGYTEDLNRWPDLLLKFHKFFLTKNPIIKPHIISFNLGELGGIKADGTHEEPYAFVRGKYFKSLPTLD